VEEPHGAAASARGPRRVNADPAIAEGFVDPNRAGGLAARPSQSAAKARAIMAWFAHGGIEPD